MTSNTNLENSISQANIIKRFCDWRKFDELTIVQFADSIVIIPKNQKNLNQLLEYWKLYETEMQEVIIQ